MWQLCWKVERWCACLPGVFMLKTVISDWKPSLKSVADVFVHHYWNSVWRLPGSRHCWVLHGLEGFLLEFILVSLVSYISFKSNITSMGIMLGSWNVISYSLKLYLNVVQLVMSSSNDNLLAGCRTGAPPPVHRIGEVSSYVGKV